MGMDVEQTQAESYKVLFGVPHFSTISRIQLQERNPMSTVRQLCPYHWSEYQRMFGDDGEAEESADNCFCCDRHHIDCICADCAGAELTAEND